MASVVFQESKPLVIGEKHHIQKGLNKSQSTQCVCPICQAIQADTPHQFNSKDIAWVVLHMMARNELEDTASVQQDQVLISH